MIESPAKIEIPQMPTDLGMTEDEWQKWCEDKMAYPGYVILAVLPGEEWYSGYVEHSFSMAFSANDTRFWWSGKAKDNIFGKEWDLNGFKNAKYHADDIRKNHPGIEPLIFDARDDELLPVTLHWKQWLIDTSPGKNGWARSKYGDRNIRFTMKTDRPLLI